MLEFISGIFIDLSLFGGIILLVLSFSNKFRKHKPIMLTAGAVLLAVGLIFFDATAVSEAYQNGLEWGKNN